MSDRTPGTLDFIASALPLVWIGVVVGVSGIATPAKFQAPNLDGALALAISVVTFAWAHTTEAVIAAATALLLVLIKARWTQWLLLVIAAIALALQIDWILPGFSGGVSSISLLPVLDFKQLHTAFGVTEVVKVVALIALAFLTFRRSVTVGTAA